MEFSWISFALGILAALVGLVVMSKLLLPFFIKKKTNDFTQGIIGAIKQNIDSLELNPKGEENGRKDDSPRKPVHNGEWLDYTGSGDSDRTSDIQQKDRRDIDGSASSSSHPE